MDATRVLDLLILARAFVEAGWCKGSSYATDAVADFVGVEEPEAANFCLVGALERAEFELSATEQNLGVALAVLRQALGWHVCFQHSRAARESSLIGFNDEMATTQADVLALFDAACERVGKS